MGFALVESTMCQLKFYLSIICLLIWSIKGISQEDLHKAHMDFIRNQGLPECIQLKYLEGYTKVLNLPTKDISEGQPENQSSVSSGSNTEQFAYMMLLNNNRCLYYGDSLFFSCILTVEVDSSGFDKLIYIKENYVMEGLLQSLAEVCNKEMISHRQAKKVARPYWKGFKLHSDESILKYDIENGKFYWALTGHRLKSERIILIDAQSGEYAHTIIP